jgi:hypothetical protein
MRRLVVLLGLLVVAFGVTALAPVSSSASSPWDCADHPGQGKSGPRLCRYCPPPEPDCQLVACDRCGCSYWCAGLAPSASATVRRVPVRR